MCLDRISQIAAQASFGTHYSSMNIDTFGNVISAGIFAGTVDFDPGPDDYILTSSLLYGDIYVSKTDPDGKLLWCKQFGEAGGNLDGVPVATLDPAGNVYVSSLFHGAIDFDPGPEVFTLVSDDADVFILKLSKDGDFRWAGQIGGNENDVPNDIAVDATGNVYSAGNFTSAASLNRVIIPISLEIRPLLVSLLYLQMG